MIETKIFTVTENGFSMDGTGKVSVPACRIKATSYTEAIRKLNTFLDTQEINPDIELITPIEQINFN